MSTLTISSHPLTGDSVYISDEGDAFYTANKLAELMGMDTHSLTRAVWFKGVHNYASDYHEILTTGGFQGVHSLIKAEDAFDVIDSYISVARKDCSQAIELRRKMGRAGAKLFAYGIGGYVVKVIPPIKIEPTQHEKLNTFNETMRTLTLLGCDLNNPRYSQMLKDTAFNILATTALPPSVTTLPWFGVVEIAESLGFDKYLCSKHCIKLGKHVARNGFLSKKDKRICNGRQIEINIYEQTVQLEQVISQYMNSI